MKKFILVTIFVLLVCGCGKNTGEKSYNKIEKRFVKMAETYYEASLKDKVMGMDRYTISLSNLKQNGYDISKIIDPDTKKSCEESSTVTIILTEKDTYTTEVNLICGEYTSKK